MDEKDNVKWLEGSTIGAPRYIILLYILIIVLIAILMLVGFHIIGKYEISEGYALFRDILAVVLSISGIAIAALGYALYLGILKHAESIMKEKEEDFISFSTALLFLNMGFFHWQHYETDYKIEEKEENKQKAYALHHRELAIELTEDAYKKVQLLNISDPRNEKMKCQIMNNLGYYLAEGDEDEEFSKRCAQYLIKRIDNFPDKRKEWQHTVNYIIKKYGPANKFEL